MRIISKEELKNILESHSKWLNNDDGLRADLSYTDLSGSNLSEADLRRADLRRADLSEADLRRADLSGANLRRADLSGANLRRADLSGANLSYTDLSGSNLSEAILPGPEIMNSICPMNCPEKGAFIGWKKAFVVLPDESGFKRDIEVIIELQIPARAKRSSATDRKCRCNEAKVLDIQSLDGKSLPRCTVAHSLHDYLFTYEIDKSVTVDDFDDNRWNECSTGIHFFITRQEAVNY